MHQILVGILAFLSLTMQGCIQIDDAEVDHSAYHLIENGQPRNFNIVGIVSHSAVVIGAARCDVVLVEQAPRRDDWWALHKICKDSPAWRRLNELCDRIKQAMPETRVHPTPDLPVEPLWIISNEPLVLAIGAAKAEPQAPSFWWPYLRCATSFPNRVRVVSDLDLSQLVKGFILIRTEGSSSLLIESPVTLNSVLNDRDEREAFLRLTALQQAQKR